MADKLALLFLVVLVIFGFERAGLFDPLVVHCVSSCNTVGCALFQHFAEQILARFAKGSWHSEITLRDLVKDLFLAVPIERHLSSQ